MQFERLESRLTIAQYDAKLLMVNIDRSTLEMFIGLTNYKNGRSVSMNLLQAESLELMSFLQDGKNA